MVNRFIKQFIFKYKSSNNNFLGLNVRGEMYLLFYTVFNNDYLIVHYNSSFNTKIIQ